MTTIQQIHTERANELAILAQDIYKEHYLHLWHPGGADWYMYEKAYQHNRIKEELADP